MISLIEVKCPHCGARGQIVMPPLGAIIVGPCPQCHEFVAVFCGHALPLDKDIVKNGDRDEKQAHIMNALTEFLEERVADLVDQSFQSERSEEQETIEPPVLSQLISEIEGAEAAVKPVAAGTISEEEVLQFLEFELPLLDNRDYFKTIFE